MRILRGRVITGAGVAATVLFGLSGFSWAKTVRKTVHKVTHSSAKKTTHSVVMTGETVVPGVMPNQEMPKDQATPNDQEATSGQEATNDVSATLGSDSSQAVEDTASVSAAPVSTPARDGKHYKLHMLNLHTGESLDIVYRIGNVYIPEALDKLNYFLRDHYTQDVSQYDPKEFDVLHAMMSRLGRLNNGVIDIVCGYRTPETNAALRRNSPWTGVAEHSQHMEGHAIDIRVPGVSTSQLRNAALSLHAGGVGYYPVSQFVHVDVGPVREWVFGRSQARRIRRRTRASAGM